MGEAGVWKEEVRGGFVDPRMLGLSGREQIGSYFQGVTPRPPIHYLTGMLPTAMDGGSVTFTMPATGWLQAPTGYVYPGALAILADGPLGSAVQAALPPMTPYTTAELSMNYVRPIPADGRTLTCRGRLIAAGKTLGLADCEILDAEERIVAHGSTRCFIFSPIAPPPEDPLVFEPVSEPSWETPAPFEREPAGEILPQDVWDRMSGLEVMRGHARGDLPAPPLHHLTGLRPTEADEGACTFAMPATGWLCSPLGKLEGGAIAMLADLGVTSAVQTTVPAGSSFAPLDLKVNFLRPVEPDGRDLIAQGVTRHRGRTIAVATSEVRDGDGRKVALATGTCLVLPDRPWRAGRPVDPSAESPG